MSDDGTYRVAKNILGGFFAAPIEALPQLSVTDVYFVHQRGTYLALYALALVGSNYFAPVICGFINDSQGYRWVFYWPTIFNFVVLVFIFLFMEETNYDRKTVGIVESADPIENNHGGKPDDSDRNRNQSPTDYSDDYIPGSRKSFFSKLSLRDSPRPQLMLHRIKQQLAFVLWPVVFFAGFAYGSNLIWFNVLNATASLIFSAAPYHFRPSIVGLTVRRP